MVGQRPYLGQAELDRLPDQAVDAEAVVGEAGVEEPPVPLGLGNAPLSQKYVATSFSEYSPGLVSTCSNSRCGGPMRA